MTTTDEWADWPEALRPTTDRDRDALRALKRAGEQGNRWGRYFGLTAAAAEAELCRLRAERWRRACYDMALEHVHDDELYAEWRGEAKMAHGACMALIYFGSRLLMLAQEGTDA